jgi:hypothetical protein
MIKAIVVSIVLLLSIVQGARVKGPAQEAVQFIEGVAVGIEVSLRTFLTFFIAPSKIGWNSNSFIYIIILCDDAKNREAVLEIL